MEIATGKIFKFISTFLLVLVIIGVNVFFALSSFWVAGWLIFPFMGSYPTHLEQLGGYVILGGILIAAVSFSYLFRQKIYSAGILSLFLILYFFLTKYLIVDSNVMGFPF